MKLITSMDEKYSRKVMEHPNEEEVKELVSYGVVVQTTAELDFRFLHRSFAEHFYTKMMTDIMKTSEEVKNVLFACEYPDGSNKAQFVSSVAGKD